MRRGNLAGRAALFLWRPLIVDVQVALLETGGCALLLKELVKVKAHTITRLSRERHDQKMRGHDPFGAERGSPEVVEAPLRQAPRDPLQTLVQWVGPASGRG